MTLLYKIIKSIFQGKNSGAQMQLKQEAIGMQQVGLMIFASHLLAKLQI